MTSEEKWLTPRELAVELGVRPSRVAQCMRVGILPYELTAGDPLIHRRQIKNLLELFPDLVAHFREENLVDNVVNQGGEVLTPQSYLRPSSIKLLRCVQRRESTIPTR